MKLKAQLLSALGIWVISMIAMIFVISAACATSPTVRTKNAGVYFKATVDGLGNAYLDYCEEVRRPSCVAKNDAAESAGAPLSEQQRVECLKPCNSATAREARTKINAVRTAQTALFLLLTRGNATEAELAAARAQLLDAVEELGTFLDEKGITQMLKNAVEG